MSLYQIVVPTDQKEAHEMASRLATEHGSI